MDKEPLKILLAGDSFAAPWPGPGFGWPRMLADKYTVTNVAQAGVSEYKILKQIERADVESFDCVIISHTSPNRLHTPNHPVHKTELHKDCDLIYADVENKRSWFNPSLSAAKGWFEYHYDQEYQNDIYKLIRKRIQEKITVPYISLNNLEASLPFVIETNSIDFSALWQTERGAVNHYTLSGNKTVFCTVDLAIQRIV